MLVEVLEKSIKSALTGLGLPVEQFAVEHPADFKNGDYSTNVALVLAKQTKTNPKELATKIVAKILDSPPATQAKPCEALRAGRFSIPEIQSVEVAGAGFINFYLTPKFFEDSLLEILREGENFGRNKNYEGKKVMVEYTDPNAFKVLHIGHLMSNAIGESISRVIDYSGAKIIRACYPSDVGLNTAKAVWGVLRDKNHYPKPEATLSEKAAFLGNAYVSGTKAYETDESAKKEIEEINKKIFEKSDAEVMKIYNEGRKWSLDHFEELYQILGTVFDRYFFESEMAPKGASVVEEFLSKGVFDKSEDAVVYKGEKVGLHTRVFITRAGLPTYEAKELGLNKAKFEAEPDLSESIIITANEQNEYFKVVLSAMKEIFPEIATKTKHISHGMMRFASGKMSSRTGNVITGESLISVMENLVFEKLKERDLSPEEKQKIAEVVAVGAIKYSILRQASGGDIIYDFEKSVSFEGDSGPYLQYSYARAASVLRKGQEISKTAKAVSVSGEEPNELARILYRFPEVVKRSLDEFEPHHIATYLTELAGTFNNFYVHNKILDAGADTPWRLSLTKAFSIVMKNGLGLLGITAPEKM